ncbi:MAG: SusD/RagB family nutrient-binding outer membrane lipoprotein [Sphingobacteriales bacterium]|nr:MAG: SusD/RagB family nutrient-binding outer membrane lipoprotein [Sphingobacteriales bacterium]
MEDINFNPNNPTVVPTTTILLSAEKQLVDNIRNENISLRGTNLFAQYYSQYIYTEQSRYDIPRSYLDTYWDNAYKTLNNLQEIIELNTNEATKDKAAAGTAGTNVNQIAIARILKSFGFQTLTDIFGNIPYNSYGNPKPEFQALQRNPEILSPVYASQEAIYADILNELKAAGDTLLKYNTLNTFGNYDVIYKGSNAKWAKFANSLRLRVATRIKEKSPSLYQEHIADAVAKGVFASNDDNAKFPYQLTAPNESPLYRATVTANRRDFGVSHIVISALKGELGPVTVADPRLPVYARPNNAGQYFGLPYGLGTAEAGILKIEEISLPGTAVNAADFAEVLQEYAEVAFLLSEYNNWSQADYERGVKASLLKWGVPEGAANTYLAAIPPADKENVLHQKYLALFTQGNEAWSEIRRTGYPLYLVKPNDIVWKRATPTQTLTGLLNSLIQSGRT